MKKAIMICLFAMFALVLAGCGSTNTPASKTYTMTIAIQGESAQAANVVRAFGATGAADPVTKTAEWFVDRPENGYISYICRSSVGNLEGQVTAKVIIRDNDGNIVTPTHEENIIWNFPPPYMATGSQAIWLGTSQEAIRISVNYTDDLVDVNDPSIITHVDLTAEATLVLVYSNAVDSGFTEFFDLANVVYVASAATAEVYHSTETVDGATTDYINAPYGVSLVLNPEIDPRTNQINGMILGSVKAVPAGLAYATKLPLVDYATYIVKLSNGGYAKLTPWMGSGKMWFIYSTSPDSNFAVSY